MKQYRKRERIAKGQGDIIVCIDESSSMKGESIAWAKSVALTLLEIAMQNSRKCAVVRFSSKSSVNHFLFEKGKYTTEDVFTFAESFYNGGTDFEEPLIRSVDLIENSGLKTADVVFLTDGECSISDAFSDWFKEKSKALNFSVTGIVMDCVTPGMMFSLETFCEKVYRTSEIAEEQLTKQIISSKI